MRKYAFLKDSELEFAKVMLYDTGNETYVFLYKTLTDDFCTYDEWYETLQGAEDAYSDHITDKGWVEIGAPLPNCQHDSILPIRIKGRVTGKPQFGVYEILKFNVWTDYIPNEVK